MTRYAFTGVCCIDNGLATDGLVVGVEDRHISYVGAGERYDEGLTEVLVDASGWFLAPGFVDLQLNGAYGVDFTEDPQSIQLVSKRLPETGVVAFLPTFITSPLEEYPTKLESVRSAMDDVQGAKVLGAHVEGPFLNPARPGAHDAELFCEPDSASLSYLTPLNAVALVTLAPEQPGGLEAVRWLRKQGVVVSVGHSDASEEQALEAFQAGVTYATHLYNAMPPIHHRRPGLAGTLLTDEAPPSGLIADGVHVNPRMVQLAWKCRGERGLTLVTDAMKAMGMPAGEYSIGGQHVHVGESGARLMTGELAGSVLRMDQAVRNMIAYTECSPAQAIRMASLTPVEVLGLSGSMGRLLTGYTANLVLLNRTLDVQATFVDGRLVYASEKALERFETAGLGIPE